MLAKKKNRATKEELEIRIFTIQGWIIEGVSEFLIKKQAKNQWNVCLKTAKRYLKLAFDGIKPDLEITIEEKCAAKIAELNQRKRNMENKFRNTPEGIRALNDIDRMIIRLQSLEPPKRVVLEGDKEKPIQHSVEIKIINTGVKIVNSEDEVDV
jgi:hypothetical protein